MEVIFMNMEIVQICDIALAIKFALKTKTNIEYFPFEYEKSIEFLFSKNKIDFLEKNYKAGNIEEWFDYWKNFCTQWLYDLGIKKENLKLRDHDKTELCFYSKATTDFEFLFPFGWGELWGIADRTDYDLSQHMKTSSKDLSYIDPVTNEKYIPYVIEPSLGVDRMVLAFLCNAYAEEQIDENDSLWCKDDIISKQFVSYRNIFVLGQYSSPFSLYLFY